MCPSSCRCLLPGVEVNGSDIAKSLIVTMLVPIVLGLMYRSHSPEGAGQWASLMNKVSGIALLLMLVTGLGLNISNIIDLIGSWGFLALILFVAGSLLIGMLMGGRDPAVRSVLGLGTAQRNVAAAILVTTLNFLRHDDAAVCAGGFHRPAADSDPDRGVCWAGAVRPRRSKSRWRPDGSRYTLPLLLRPLGTDQVIPSGQ